MHRNLRAGYGEAVVLPDMSLRLAEGQVLALLGRNGTGKTTLINSIVGVTRRFGGTLALGGRDITAMRPDQRARAGIGWVPQERNIFRSLTVEENMTAVAQPGPWTVERVYEMFPRLKERRNNFGNQLSGGEQQMLAIGRALMLNPTAAAAGRADRGAGADHRRGTAGALGTITRAAASAPSLSNRTRKRFLGLADRVVILERGAIVHDAASAALKADPAVLERFRASRVSRDVTLSSFRERVRSTISPDFDTFCFARNRRTTSLDMMSSSSRRRNHAKNKSPIPRRRGRQPVAAADASRKRAPSWRRARYRPTICARSRTSRSKRSCTSRPRSA